MPNCDYPLRFKPLFRRYLWGGRRLETMLGKQLGPGDDYAESWEVVDHGEDQSVVANGNAAGRTLHELVTADGEKLFGQHAPQPQFPLLLKFLDCNRTLSVQVHPNDAQAALLDPPDLGKTEAWVVLAADPGSKIYAGLKPGVTREGLRQALAAGTCEECLHAFEPRVGDCVFIRAGTVHALGAGLVIAEIQQASDTTFRLYDFNRVDAAGTPRPLHVEQSLATIDYDLGSVHPVKPVAAGNGRERLVNCDKFVLDRLTLAEPQTIGGDKRFHLLVGIEGALGLGDESLRQGESLLVPAAAGEVELKPRQEAVVLDIYLPQVARMKVPLNALSIIFTVTLTALFGMLLGGLFGWIAGSLAPGIFVDDQLGWDSNQRRWAAVVFCAGAGILCGGALGAFAVAVQALIEWCRGS